MTRKCSILNYFMALGRDDNSGEARIAVRKAALKDQDSSDITSGALSRMFQGLVISCSYRILCDTAFGDFCSLEFLQG